MNKKDTLLTIFRGIIYFIVFEVLTQAFLALAEKFNFDFVAFNPIIFILFAILGTAYFRLKKAKNNIHWLYMLSIFVPYILAQTLKYLIGYGTDSSISGIQLARIMPQAFIILMLIADSVGTLLSKKTRSADNEVKALEKKNICLSALISLIYVIIIQGVSLAFHLLLEDSSRGSLTMLVAVFSAIFTVLGCAYFYLKKFNKSHPLIFTASTFVWLLLSEVIKYLCANSQRPFENWSFSIVDYLCVCIVLSVLLADVFEMALKRIGKQTVK